jgi:hypothetical protein
MGSKFLHQLFSVFDCTSCLVLFLAFLFWLSLVFLVYTLPVIRCLSASCLCNLSCFTSSCSIMHTRHPRALQRLQFQIVSGAVCVSDCVCVSVGVCACVSGFAGFSNTNDFCPSATVAFSEKICWQHKWHSILPPKSFRRTSTARASLFITVWQGVHSGLEAGISNCILEQQSNKHNQFISSVRNIFTAEGLNL